MPSGSRPFAGSSRISTPGSPSMAAASCSRCRIPRLNPPTRRSAASSRPTWCSVAATRAASMPAGEREHAQVVACRAGGVEAGRLERSTDDAHGRGDPVVGPAADRRRAGGGGDETEQAAQRGGLAGAVRPEEAGDPSGLHDEREVVDGEHLTEPLGQALDRDGESAAHTRTLPQGAGAGPVSQNRRVRPGSPPPAGRESSRW